MLDDEDEGEELRGGYTELTEAGRRTSRHSRRLTFWTRLLPAREWCRLAAFGVSGVLGVVGILCFIAIIGSGKEAGLLALGVGGGIGVAGFSLFAAAVFPIDGLEPALVVGEILSRAAGAFLMCAGVLATTYFLVTFKPGKSGVENLLELLFRMTPLVLVPLGFMFVVGSYRSWSNW